MSHPTEEKFNNRLQKARMKSKEFYFKTALASLEQVCKDCSDAMAAIKTASKQLEAYAEGDFNGLQYVSEEAQKAADLAAKMADNASEAAEAAALAVSVELQELNERN